MNQFRLEPVVITGVGVLACNGIGREAFWNALENGRSGRGMIDRVDTEKFPCKIGGQLWDFDPRDFISSGTIKRWHRAVHQSVAAARLALDDAAFEAAGYRPDRVPVGIGTSVGSPDHAEGGSRQGHERHGRGNGDKWG